MGSASGGENAAGIDEESILAESGITRQELDFAFPKLQIIELLGSGGMGIVYKAIQSGLDREVALKILSCPAGQFESFSLRFEQEAKILARLNHRGIVTVFDSGKVMLREGSAPLFYILMEYVEGGDLQHLLSKGAMEPEEAFRVIADIAEALGCAHENGILHRDIKPANLLVSESGEVRIADFGVARLIALDGKNGESGLTITGTTVGTPFYIAPEVWDDPESVDHRADIYALGVVLHHMLTGERPTGHLESPSRLLNFPGWIDKPVMKAISRKPEDRYDSVGEFSSNARKIAERIGNLPRQRIRRIYVGVGVIALISLVAVTRLGFFQRDANAPVPTSVDILAGENEQGRVYIHCHGDEQINSLNALPGQLEEAKFRVVHTRDIGEFSKLPVTTEVRYFRDPEEKAGAEKVLGILRRYKNIPHPRLLFVSGYSSRNRQNHYEVWMGQDAFGNEVGAGLKFRRRNAQWSKGKVRSKPAHDSSILSVLSQRKNLSDFLSITANGEHWYALRDNGEMISSHPDHNRRYVDSVSLGSEGVIATVETGGEIEFLGDSEMYPASRYPDELVSVGVVQLQVGAGQSIALLENGGVAAWGPCYEEHLTPSGMTEAKGWEEPPAISTECRDIAAGSNFAAALSETGEVIVWGKEGIVHVNGINDYLPIRDIESSGEDLYLLSEKGMVLQFRMERESVNSPDDLPVKESVILNETASAEVISGNLYYNEETGWRTLHRDPFVDNLLAGIPKVGPDQITVIPGSGAQNGQKKGAKVYWIE
ncbi:MAG: protein kinase [Verrucomicrobiales bacterium]|nr:protein kinase [Verrucomicrobiales bacterium]